MRVGSAPLAIAALARCSLTAMSRSAARSASVVRAARDDRGVGVRTSDPCILMAQGRSSDRANRAVAQPSG
jgi:hypothetical protein